MVARSLTPPVPLIVEHCDIPAHMTVREYRRAAHPRRAKRRRLGLRALFRRRAPEAAPAV